MQRLYRVDGPGANVRVGVWAKIWVRVIRLLLRLDVGMVFCIYLYDSMSYDYIS